MENTAKKDIWSEGIKTIFGYHKRSLLSFLDLMQNKSATPEEIERIGLIKGRIHNELSQAAFEIGVLFITMRSGGDITPFEDSFLRRNMQTDSKLNQKFDNGVNREKANKIVNKVFGTPVLK